MLSKQHVSYLANIVVIACLAPILDAIETILSLLNPLLINVSYFSNIVFIACLAPPFDAIDTILSILNPLLINVSSDVEHLQQMGEYHPLYSYVIQNMFSIY